MAATLKQVFNVVDEQARALGSCWQLYEQVYRAGPVQIEMLNRMASTFFAVAGLALEEQIILNIARLFDPPGNAHQENASLRKLTACVEAELGRDQAMFLKEELERVGPSAAAIIKRRHKALAHTDLNVALSVRGSNLPDISINEIKFCMGGVEAILNAVRHRLGHPRFSYLHPLQQGDGEALLKALHAGDESLRARTT